VRSSAIAGGNAPCSNARGHCARALESSLAQTALHAQFLGEFACCASVCSAGSRVQGSQEVKIFANIANVCFELPIQTFRRFLFPIPVNPMVFSTLQVGMVPANYVRLLPPRRVQGNNDDRRRQRC
jgi:hypothetical protein